MAGMDRAEVLKKIASSTISGGGNNLRDGRGRLALRKFEMTDGFKGTRVVFEFVVVQSQKVPVVSIKTSEKLDIEPNPVGSDVSIVNMISKHESAYGNVKATILALCGASEMSEQDLIDTMGDMLENGAGIGRVVDFTTYRKVTDKNKVEIVLPKWFVVQQTDADVEAMKRWFSALDANAAAQAASAVPAGAAA